MDTINSLLAHVWVVLACAVAGALMLLWVEYDRYRSTINDIADDASWAEWWHERVDESDHGRGA